MIQEICRYAGLKRKNDLDCPGTADVNKENTSSIAHPL